MNDAQRALGLSDEELIIAHLERMTGGYVALRAYAHGAKVIYQALWYKRCAQPKPHLHMHQIAGYSALATLTALADYLTQLGFLPTQAA